MINEKALKSYLKNKFNAPRVKIRRLGSGVQGSGFLVELRTRKGSASYVIKSLIPEGFGHDYPSDRAAVFLQDLDEFNSFPAHVKAIDVLAEMKDGSVKSIGGGREYYLLMEQGEGMDYFNDLIKFSQENRLEKSDIEKVKALTSYLAGVHSVKKDSRTLYWRKLRDTVGHGECLMGVLDLYPEGILSDSEMKDIIKKSVDWNYKLKPRFRRLSQIHGDFHPGNVWFANDTDFVLLDRSRGPWGEPADDVTALTMNYVFFSIKHHGIVKGPYLEALRLFYEDYIRLSGDQEIYSVVQLFYAFRGVVVANPVFYPDLAPEQRLMIFRFINNVLDSERFEPEMVNEYLK
jgi:aminoglycoside phosphotransferase (APT) family kinase protein